MLRLVWGLLLCCVAGAHLASFAQPSPACCGLRCSRPPPARPPPPAQVPNAPGAKLSAATFSRYWLNYDRGAISIGRGEPGEDLCYCWTDPEPIAGIRFAGGSTAGSAM